MSVRLKYRIVKVSSEDPEFPAAELLVHSSQTKGWQSASSDFGCASSVEIFVNISRSAFTEVFNEPNALSFSKSMAHSVKESKERLARL